MSITLSPEIEALVAEQLTSGQFKTADEVVAAGLRSIKDQASGKGRESERFQALRKVTLRLIKLQNHKSTFSSKEELNELIQEGLDAIERGELISGDEAERELKEFRQAWRLAGL